MPSVLSIRLPVRGSTSWRHIHLPVPGPPDVREVELSKTSLRVTQRCARNGRVGASERVRSHEGDDLRCVKPMRLGQWYARG